MTIHMLLGEDTPFETELMDFLQTALAITPDDVFAMLLYSNQSGETILSAYQMTEQQFHYVEMMPRKEIHDKSKKIGHNLRVCTSEHIPILGPDQPAMEIWSVYNNLDANEQLMGMLYISKNHSKNLYEDALQQTFSYGFSFLHMKISGYEKLFYLVDTFSEIIASKDKFMPHHMSNVANWCMQMATEMHMISRDRMVLYVAALIHDIGKIYISDDILNKPGKLTETEYLKVKSHSRKSAEIATATLYGMHFFQEVPNIILHHHEHYNGKGYPDRLSGNDIPFLSRMIAVADAVDAMMSRRSYKEKQSLEKIERELERCSGIQFDPQIAEIMLKLIKRMQRHGGISTIADTSFIPNSAFFCHCENTNEPVSWNGNLIVNSNIGKLMLHHDVMDNMQENAAQQHTAHIAYYMLDDLSEYRVNLMGCLDGQLLMDRFEYIQADRFISIQWEMNITAECENQHPISIHMIKFGSHTIIFEVPTLRAYQFQMNLNTLWELVFPIGTLDEVNAIRIPMRVVRFYDFNESFTFVGEFEEMDAKMRDLLVRLLFRKQMKERIAGGQTVGATE